MVKWLPFLSIILAMSIWSLWPLVVRSIPMDPISLTISVFFFSSSLYILLALFKKPRGFTLFRKKWFFFLIGTIFLLINSATYFKSLRLSPVPLAVITHYTAPIFVALLSPILIKEKRKKFVFLSILLSTIGLSISLNLTSIKKLSIIGPIYGLISGLFYGMGVVVAKLIVFDFDPYEYLFFASLTSIPIYLPLFILKKPPLGLIHYLILIAVFFSIIPAYIYLWGLKRLSAQATSVTSYIEPILAILWGALILGERIEANVLVGGLLVFTSSYLVLREE